MCIASVTSSFPRSSVLAHILSCEWFETRVSLVLSHLK